MTIETVTEFFQWCTIIGMGLYIWTAIMTIFAKGFLQSFHQKLFGLSEETFKIAIYAYLGVFKIMLILFVLVPYLALLAMG